MITDKSTSLPLTGRRGFLATAGLAAAGSLWPARANAEMAPTVPMAEDARLRTGNGEWTFDLVPGWGHLPEGKTFGGTHGAIATDKAGLVYVSTQSTTGVLVYDASGKLVRTIAEKYPEVHSMYYTEEGGQEVLYTTVQKGTPEENWLFVKMKMDGTVLQKITAPGEAGFKKPDEWRITSAVKGPDGSIFIANGYGDSRIFVFDSKGNYKKAFGGKGDAENMFDCSHGLAVDTRYGQPLLMVADREHRRLCHFDFDGKYVRTLTTGLRRPCQISFWGDYAVISELEGRVTVLDKGNVPVAFLGDNPDKKQWANYGLKPGEIAPVYFSAAHGTHIDKAGDVYVSDWNATGRITKLTRVQA